MNESKNIIMDALKNMDDYDLVQVWNEYTDAVNCYDDRIYTMDEFNMIYENEEPEEVARRVFYGSDEWNENGSFNPNRDYFYFNGYGNPISLDYIGWNGYAGRFSCSILDENALCDYIVENENALYNDDLQQILDDAEIEAQEA